MENNRRRDGKSEHHTHERDTKQQNRNTPLKGFEGMNFEQQRGSYKNSDGGGRPNDAGARDPEERQNEL